MDHGHAPGLILTISGSLVAAFLGGFIATRLRLPAILGYLLAGIAIGPFTPGFTGDAKVASELAEIGVILLMFGVGIHFSLRQLLAVRGVAVPGALGQIALATGLGAALALSWGWGWGGAIVLGLAVSVASTVVLLRGLAENNLLVTHHGRVTVGWLIVEDLFTVLVLVLLPALAVSLGGQPGPGLAAAAGGGNVFLTLLLALGKTGLFIFLMIFAGTRAFPWFLAQVARTNSRELFTLAVLAVALGVAVGSAALLGVSLALGAFLAGMVISESEQSHQAAADALPMRDAFAVLFFVSVGMLFNPAVLLRMPLEVAAVVAVVIVGKALTGFGIVAALGYPIRTGLTVAAGLAQIGEFSFIVAQLGRSLHLLPDEGYQLIIAGALISITLNPLLFRLIPRVEDWLRERPELAARLEWRTALLRPTEAGEYAPPPAGHVVICGYGRVGSLIGELLEQRGTPYVVVEQSQREVERLRERGVKAYYGDASNAALLEHLHLDEARALVLAIPDAIAVRRAVEYARSVNPRLRIVARTHSEREWEYLQERVDGVVLGEREAAVEMARATLTHLEGEGPDVDSVVEDLRARVGRVPVAV